MQDFEKSPLQVYCEQQDKTYFDKSILWQYENVALRSDKTPEERKKWRIYFTNLFLNDITWRGDHQQNWVGSIEGQQSSGKSFFGINIAIRLGLAFRFPFVLDRDLFANPYDLERELRSGERRRTYQYDEQPQRMVGMGSGATRISLSDWEDIARYTQKNIIYCSPEVYEHSHYFVFQQVEYDIKRIKNEACRECKFYSVCQESFYITLCEKGKVNKGIKFFERDGYPIEFSFMLFTKRLVDKMLVPRGVVTFPMVTPVTAKLYDEIKNKNIVNFEGFVNDAWKMKLKEIEEFIDEYFVKLTIYKNVKGVDRLFVAPNPVIEGFFYDKFTTSKFTQNEVKIFTALIKKDVADRVNRINSGLSTFDKCGKA